MTREHWFGTDEFGRDFYAQMVYGARGTFIVAFISVGLATAVGLVAGLVSGHFGGWVNNLVQRLVEIMMSFLTIALALALMAVLGQGLDKVIIAMAIIYTPQTTRVIRGIVLSVKENTYVDAAQAIGAEHIPIMLVYILPQLMAVYLIIGWTLLGSAVLLEAALSYLGLPPPNPSWGRFLSGNVAAYAFSAPHLVIIPGLAITVLVLAFNLLGDAVRDVWDPRLRGT
jgi:ABC-type dipeptide/oligopeptide/nickel transport system permease subunit